MDNSNSQAPQSSPTNTSQEGTTPPPLTSHDPGKELAIIGIVLSFFLNIAGLIVSIVARKRSKKAGYPTTLATVGIVLNSVSLAVSIIMIPLLFLLIIVGYGGIQERAEGVSWKSTALKVVKKSEAYSIEHNNVYPVSVSEFESDPASSLTSIDVLISSKPLTTSDTNQRSKAIELYECAGTGNKIGYWDFDSKDVQYEFSGTANLSSPCTLIY
jgi:hypothetical protein